MRRLSNLVNPLITIEDDFKNMVQCLEYLIESFPKKSILHQRNAEAHIYENNFQKAITHLKRAVDLGKKDLIAKVLLILSYYKIGNAKEANARLNDLKNLAFICPRHH